MKTYKQMIEIHALEKWHDYMGGANFPRATGVDTTATIFEKDGEVVYAAVDKRFEEIRDTFYETKEMPTLPKEPKAKEVPILNQAYADAVEATRKAKKPRKKRFVNPDPPWTGPW